MTTFITNSDLIIRLGIAVLLGMVIGAERFFVHKDAGLKTHSLVSLGAALFMVISEFMAHKYANSPGFNPAMMSSQIIVGIGFLGAGSIIFQGSRLTGLTTAGGLWVTAGIGMAVGLGLYMLACIATLLVLLILLSMNLLEKPLRRLAEETDARNKDINL